jgi:hypothetical protein
MPPQNIDGLIRIGMDEFITSEIQTGETSIFVRSQGPGRRSSCCTASRKRT